MTEKDLERANYLKDKIRKLDYFLFSYKRRPKTNLIVEKRKYILTALPYGPLIKEEYIVPEEVKDEIINVLENKLKVYKDELENL